jgi:hypothetical protein
MKSVGTRRTVRSCSLNCIPTETDEERDMPRAKRVDDIVVKTNINPNLTIEIAHWGTWQTQLLRRLRQVGAKAFVGLALEVCVQAMITDQQNNER